MSGYLPFLGKYVPPPGGVDPEENVAVQKLRAAMPDAIEEVNSFRDQVTVRVFKDHIVTVCRFLRDTPELEFDFLTDLTAVDSPERPKRFDVVSHLYSMTVNHRLRLKAGVAEDEPIESVTSVWKAA